MHAEDLSESQPRRTPPDPGAVLALQASLSALLAFTVTVIWGFSTRGYFWPGWVWLGLAIPLGLHFFLRLAWKAEPGRPRRFAVHAVVSGVLMLASIFSWVLARPGFFWPIWTLLVLGLALAVHAVLIGMWDNLRPSEREQELSERVDVLTRTRRGALDVQADELRRIERDLHDGAQARLVALSMQLGRAEERLTDQPEVAALVRQARDEAGAAIAELRDLARGISPPVLADRGLVAAIESLGPRVSVPVTVESSMARRPVPVLESAAYFVVAEALTNVAKHAGSARARVKLDLDDERLSVEISDDGAGGANPNGGGLAGLRHRVEALDGTLTVSSPAAGGTTIRAELPCAS
jgi:signal transduction histidine kinase